jgi:hypothetical protein
MPVLVTIAPKYYFQVSISIANLLRCALQIEPPQLSKASRCASAQECPSISSFTRNTYADNAYNPSAAQDSTQEHQLAFAYKAFLLFDVKNISIATFLFTVEFVIVQNYAYPTDQLTNQCIDTNREDEGGELVKRRFQRKREKGLT